MTRSEAWAWPLAALLTASAARADPGPATSLRLWAGPEGIFLRPQSPYAPGTALAGVGREDGQAEAVLRLSWHGAAGELSARQIMDHGGGESEAVVTELYEELDALGQHFTLGKKVTSWGVGYGFRPLDVVEEERRQELRPFALEGVPQIAWEWLDERWAVTVLWAHPLAGRALLPQHDESVAAQVFHRLGQVDVQAVARVSSHTGLEAGAGTALVLGESLELHGSALWQARGEHLAPPDLATPLPTAPPAKVARQDEVALLLGFTLTPGLGLSFLGEAWFDPDGDGRASWRARRRLVERDQELGASGAAPAPAVAGNLAYGLLAFDRQSLLQENLLAHASLTAGRLEPAVDLLVTPEDRGWVATAQGAYQGERLRFEAGLRIMGGPPGAAYALYPGRAEWYMTVQVSL